MTDKKSLAEAIKAFAEEERQKNNVHLALPDLQAYLEGETSEEETERIRDHLALCRQCADRTLGLKQDSAPLVTGREQAAARTVLASPRFAYGVAAVCLVIAAAALFRLSGPMQNTLSRPQLNVQHVPLFLGTTRSDARLTALQTQTAHNFSVILDNPGISERYAVEILRKTSAGTEMTWSTDRLFGMQNGSSEYLSFVLPSGYLKPGSYVVRISVSGDNGRLLGEDSFTVNRLGVE